MIAVESILSSLLFLAVSSPVQPDRLADRVWLREARPLTLAQAKALLWNSSREVTVEQLERALSVRPVRKAAIEHHWPMADGILLTMSSPQPDGRLVITCWGTAQPAGPRAGGK